MSKLVLVAAAATGYVLGARAGRARFDQIAAVASGLVGGSKAGTQRAAVDESVQPETDLLHEPDELVYSTGPDVTRTSPRIGPAPTS